MLRFHEDRTTDDIAGTLGCRPGTARVADQPGPGGPPGGDRAVTADIEDLLRTALARRADSTPARAPGWAGSPRAVRPRLRPHPDDGSWYAQARGRHGVRVTGSFPLSVDVTTDGRVATFARPTPRGEPAELRLAGGDGGQETVALPVGFAPRALAAGPDRWVALVGDLAECCPSADHPALVLVPPRGEPRVVDVSEALPGGIPTAPGRPMITWGATGQVAVSTDTLPPAGGAASPPAVRTVVLDPTRGRLVAEIDGFRGVHPLLVGGRPAPGQPSRPSRRARSLASRRSGSMRSRTCRHSSSRGYMAGSSSGRMRLSLAR